MRMASKLRSHRVNRAVLLKRRFSEQNRHLDTQNPSELVQQPDSGSLRTPLNLRDVVLTHTGQLSHHSLCLVAPLR